MWARSWLWGNFVRFSVGIVVVWSHLQPPWCLHYQGRTRLCCSSAIFAQDLSILEGVWDLKSRRWLAFCLLSKQLVVISILTIADWRCICCRLVALALITLSPLFSRLQAAWGLHHQQTPFVVAWNGGMSERGETFQRLNILVLSIQSIYHRNHLALAHSSRRVPSLYSPITHSCKAVAWWVWDQSDFWTHSCNQDSQGSRHVFLFLS